MIGLELKGSPLAKKRPRFFRTKNRICTFDPQNTEKKSAQLQIAEQYQLKPLECAVCIEMIFYMPIPISLSKKKREKMDSGEIIHDKKPDLDNILKFYLDCMNKIVFDDDSQVVSINARKVYSFFPKTVINVYPLTEMRVNDHQQARKYFEHRISQCC